MFRLLYLTVSMIGLSLILLSCASVKPEIYSYSPDDLSAKLYYRNGTEPGDNSPYVSRTLNENVETSVLAQNAVIDLSTKSNIVPSISSDGLYIAFHDDNNSDSKYQPYSHEQTFNIYDVRANAIVLSAVTSVTSGTALQSPYSVPWSYFGHAFYVLQGDTIKKCTVDGKQTTLAVIDNLINFSVSPSEHWLLFVQKDRVGYINLETKEVVLVKNFDTIFGIGLKRTLRVISWSPDESNVVFTEGFRMTIVNLEKRENNLHKVSAEIFSVEWLTNNSFVYVEGYLPNPDSPMNGEPFFEINSYSLETKRDELLHRRENHEPVSVKPKLSPSGNLLAFSEKKVAGVYEVHLLSTDGSAMMTLCQGYAPVWGR